MENGSYLGIIQEVMDGTVDTSSAGFTRTFERSELVDFSPQIMENQISTFIKRPAKNDVSLRYFLDGKW